ncbi:MAG: hypothetical protein AAFX55_04265 [Bacteroidota bacterium]
MDIEKEIFKDLNWKKFILVLFLISVLLTVFKTFNYSLIKIIDGNETYWQSSFIFSISVYIVWGLLTPIIFVTSIRFFLEALNGMAMF